MKLIKNMVRPSMGIYASGFYENGELICTFANASCNAIKAMYDGSPSNGPFDIVMDELYETN